MQLTVPAEMRGRVMGIYMLVFLGGAPLGVAADWLGRRAVRHQDFSMIAGAAISVVATVVVAVFVARFRGMPVRSYLRQARFARTAA